MSTDINIERYILCLVTFINTDCDLVHTSLVPRPFEGEEKGPGTHCLHMLRYPKNLGGLDTIVNYSASLIRIPVHDINVHSPFELYTCTTAAPSINHKIQEMAALEKIEATFDADVTYALQAVGKADLVLKEPQLNAMMALFRGEDVFCGSPLGLGSPFAMKLYLSSLTSNWGVRLVTIVAQFCFFFLRWCHS